MLLTVEVSEEQLIRDMNEKGWLNSTVIAIPELPTILDFGMAVWNGLVGVYGDTMIEVKVTELVVDGFGDVMGGGQFIAVIVGDDKYLYEHILDIWPENWLSVGCTECTTYDPVKIILGHVQGENKCAFVRRAESSCRNADDFIDCPEYWAMELDDEEQ